MVRQRGFVIIMLITGRTVEYMTFFTMCIPHVLHNRILDKLQYIQHTCTVVHVSGFVDLWRHYYVRIIKCMDLYVDYCLKHQVCKVHLQTLEVNKFHHLSSLHDYRYVNFIILVKDTSLTSSPSGKDLLLTLSFWIACPSW